MKKIEIVPRIRINGEYHSIRDIPREELDAIIEERLNLAMGAMNYQRVDDRSA